MSMHYKKPFASMTDIDFKEKGNQYFIGREYEKAAQCYTNAIIRNPSNPVYFSNRALVGLKLNTYNSVVADCHSALELDPTHIKSHFFLGQALCEMDLIDEGVKHLQRAVDLSREQRLNYGDEMTQVLRLWRKKRFEVQENKRLSREIELQSYLTRLIQEDRERQTEALRNSATANEDAGSSCTDVNQSIAAVESFSDTCMGELNNLFSIVDERRRKREVPDYLCGKISFDILRDPVITPSGITYERKDIEDHLMRVGHFDPVTRVALTSDQLIPNYVMKEVVDAFVSENEWALDY